METLAAQVLPPGIGFEWQRRGEFRPGRENGASAEPED
jgi:hypothetical protein